MWIIINIANMSLIYCCFVLVNIEQQIKQQKSNHKLFRFSLWKAISHIILCPQLTEISIGFHDLTTIPTSASASKATTFSSSSKINKQEIILQFYLKTTKKYCCFITNATMRNSCKSMEANRYFSCLEGKDTILNGLLHQKTI